MPLSAAGGTIVRPTDSSPDKGTGHNENYGAGSSSGLAGVSGILNPSGLPVIQQIWQASPLNSLSFTVPIYNLGNDGALLLPITALNTSPVFSPDPVSNYQINISGNLTVFSIIGTVRWAASAVGIRYVYLNAYDQVNTFLGQVELFKRASDATSPYVHSVSYGYANIGIAYMAVGFYQNSGGPLNVDGSFIVSQI